MAGPSDKIFQALGNLEGTVKALQGIIADMSSQWRDQEHDAAEGRRALYGRFEELSSQVAGSISTLESISDEVDEIKTNINENIMPTITSYRLTTSYSAGFASMGKTVWAAILASATVIGFLIHETVQYFRGTPGHWPH